MDEQSLPYRQLTPHQKRERLTELAIVFLKLGTLAFGGPAAHIAMIDDEVVKHRRWMDRDTLLDLLGVTNLIPGPNSTELAIHIGYTRAGLVGLVVAGCCFILPAMIIVWTLAALYVQSQAIPQLGWLLYGIKPVIIAIVVQAVWKLGKTAMKDWPTILVTVVAIAAFFLGINEILILVVAGIGVMVIKNLPPSGTGSVGFGILSVPPAIAQVGLTPTDPVATGPNAMAIFLFFLKIGCVLYGSGYVLLAFLQRGLVEQHHWLTSQQLLDAVAIGQFTPGPVFTTATFVGYLLAGNWGAIAATVGIFLPAFVLVAVTHPWIPKLRRSSWSSGFLDGVNAASLGLMAAVTYILGRAALVDWLTIGLVLLSAIAVFRFRVNSSWLVLAGGVAGFLAKLSQVT